MKYLLWSIPIILCALYFGGYYFLGSRISIFSEGIWRIWVPLLNREIEYEAERVPIWFEGEWISEDGKELVITFSEDQNMRIESADFPDFQRDGFWGLSEIPTAFRYRSIQINVDVTENESLWMGVSQGVLRIHRFTSFDPTADPFKPRTPAPFAPIAFTRKPTANKAE